MKRKKIYYVSGMISLVLIAPLFYNIFQPKVSDLDLRVLEIGLPEKSKNSDVSSAYKIPIEGWNYETINLPDNFGKKEEEIYYNKIKDLQRRNIDKTGIKFQFSENTSYNSFVQLINLMHKTKQEMYGIDTENNNSFYVVHKKFKQNYSDVIFNFSKYNEEKNDESFLKKFTHLPKESYYLLVGYLVLLSSIVLKFWKIRHL